MGDPAEVDDRIDRASAEDMLQLATDVGPVPMQVGAVLVLGDGPSLELADVRAAIEERSKAVPRLRRRLESTPPGCGRPVWVSDERFAIADHVKAAAWPAPGDEDTLLALAAGLVTTALPTDRSPWSATLVSGPAGQALVVVFHHVLADGIGGLAVLANLVDGAVPLDLTTRVRRPSTAALAVDAWRHRLGSLRHVGAGVAAVRAARVELGQGRGVKAARCSLLVPTGPDRAFSVARVPLAPIVDLAHQRGATVNDIVLTAAAAALADTLTDRGEAPPPTFVVSVPVSARREADAESLGNRVGVMPVAVPTRGSLLDRLAETGAARRRHQGGPAGSSTALLAPMFRLLAGVGLFRWFIERQRLIHTFVTNVHGPDDRLRFLDHEVTAVVPLTSVAGNVTVAFAVLSYAGTLGVTVVADPEHCTDHRAVRDHLERRLVELVGASDEATRSATAPASP